MNNSLNSVIQKTSRNLCLDKKIVEQIYRSYWNFIRNKIEELSLNNITEEELVSIESNFNLPYIGKLYVDYEKIEKYKRKLKYIQDAGIKRNKTNRKSGTGD